MEAGQVFSALFFTSLLLLFSPTKPVARWFCAAFLLSDPGWCVHTLYRKVNLDVQSRWDDRGGLQIYCSSSGFTAGYDALMK